MYIFSPASDGDKNVHAHIYSIGILKAPVCSFIEASYLIYIQLGQSRLVVACWLILMIPTQFL